MKKIYYTVLLSASLSLLLSCQTKSIDLSGEWKFQIDRNDTGETDGWFSKPLTDAIILPGSMASNGLGDDITLETKWTGGIQNPDWPNDPNYAPYFDPDNVRFPYWLQPVKKYTGAAWYQKAITIPKSWDHKAMIISLERPHWETTLWLDDQKIGTQNSLATAHNYLLPDNIPAGDHLITIRVDNRIKDVDVGWNSHSITDHTQTNWNGIVGKISIRPISSASMHSVRITPDFASHSIVVDGIISYTGKSKSKAHIKYLISGPMIKDQMIKSELDINPGENNFTLKQKMSDDMQLWDEFNPVLYNLELELNVGKEKSKFSESFGIRKVEATNEGLKINNHPLFLRGTLECAIFPLTGYPATDTDEWKRIFRVIKSHGLNHMRFHSWCPPEAAFIAADQTGVYLQVECSSWANSPTTRIGDGMPIDQFIWDESKAIVKNYGNHPSFIMMAYGNEPGGRNHKAFLTEFVSYWKEHDPRRLYTSAASWPQLAVNDYHSIAAPRLQRWGEGLNSLINSKPPTTDYDWTSRMPADGKTVVSHEIGQWCVYPNFKEIKKYTGVLKAKNFEIFQESLEANHMGYLADSFLIASGKLQALCYKADIEAALRTPRFGGFQLLDLHDFPGQGTALVGVLDAFWEEKGYISPEEFSHFCNTVVPLARLPKRIFLEGETMKVPVQIANYSPENQDLQNVGALNTDTKQNRLQNSNALSGSKNIAGNFKITDVHNKTIAEGSFGKQELVLGNKQYLGTIKHTFKKTGKPRKLTIDVSIAEYSNSWDIWVYPGPPDKSDEPGEPDNSAKPDVTNKPDKSLKTNKANEQADIRIVSSIDKETRNFLSSGGKVLLSLGKGKVAPKWGGDIAVGFSSIFWNTAWTRGQKPHTLGILCNPQHPALADFPTEYYSNWQWWDAMSHSDAIMLNSLPVELKPIVRIIDDWVSNRRLALLFEAKTNGGSILVSGVDLVSDLDNRPAARQLRYSLINYMESEKFNPAVELDTKVLESIVRD